MKIDRVSLNNFGRFGEFAASFGPGINLIKGANEAGKSTLVEAITAALFTDAKCRKRNLLEKAKWGSEGARVAISLSSDDAEYDLNKDFLSGVQVLEDKANQAQWETRDGIDKFLESNFGISDAVLFNVSACVPQDEMDKISRSSDALRDKLESIITGGREEVVAGKVIEDLKKRISDIKKEGSKNPGMLKKLESEQKELEYEIDRLTRELEATEARRGELVEVASGLEQSAKEYSEKSVSLQKLEKALQLKKARAELEEQYRNLKSCLEEIRSSEQKVISYREQISGKPEIKKEHFNDVCEVGNRLHYLDDKVSDLQEDRKLLENNLQEIGETGNYVRLNILNFLLILCCGVGAYLYDLRLAAGSGFFLLMQVILIALLWKRSSARAAAQSQVKFVDRRIEDIKSDSEKARERLNEVLRIYDLRSPEQIKETYSLTEECHRKINEETARYEELLKGKKLKALHEEFDRVSRELEDVKSQSDQFEQVLIEPDELEKLKSRVEEITLRKIQLEEKKKHLTEQLELSEGGGEQLAAFEERLEHNRKMYQRYDRRLNICRVTASLLEIARSNILKATAELLETRVGKYLSDITGGKYSRIRFDKSSLEFSVFSPEKQDWIEARSNLSRGTIDQIYLCARLALLEVIAGDRNPFIILDDPFVHFDPQRARNAMNVIKQMSAEHQILLFTNSDNYDEIADQLIQL